MTLLSILLQSLSLSLPAVDNLINHVDVMITLVPIEIKIMTYTWVVD